MIYIKRPIKWKEINTILTGMLVVALSISFFLIVYRFDNKYTFSGPKASMGILDLDNQNMDEFPVLFLIDGWEYYSDRLLEPNDFKDNPPSPDQYIFIGQYGGFEADDKESSPHGSATYRLTIQLPHEKQTYMLELPEIFSAYNLYINGNLALTMGNPDPENYSAEIGNRTITIEVQDQIEILLNVSDYSRFYSGIVYPPAFGYPKEVSNLLNTRLVFRSALCAVALAVGILSVVIVFLSHRNSIAALYGAICLLFIGYISYPITQTFFSGSNIQYSIETLSFCGMLTAVTILTKKVCSSKNKISILFILFGLSMCVATVFLPFVLAESNLRLMLVYSALLSIYEWAVAGFITFSALQALLKKEVRIKALLYGILIFDCALIMDRLLPLHEPIATGWFVELASFALVIAIGAVIALGEAELYKSSAILTERANSMERLYQSQLSYFDSLKQEMKETKKMRHDMRHHFTIIDNFIINNQYAQLSEYVSGLNNSFKEYETMDFCPINVINVLSYHFYTIAEQNRIHFELRHDIRGAEGKEGIVNMSDADLCCLYSNLMENAIEACLRIDTGRRLIRVAVVRPGEDHLIIRVQNSTDGNIKKQGDAAFLSSKAEGRKGYGMSSVESIAQKYGGSASFDWDKASRIFEANISLSV